MSDLYEDEILLWSERQAELLRPRASGELVNDAEIDWPNVAEEIKDSLVFCNTTAHLAFPALSFADMIIRVDRFRGPRELWLD